MRPTDIGAQPLALLNLATIYADAVQASRQPAVNLANILDRFAATCTEYPLGITGAIAHDWQRHLDAVAGAGSFALGVAEQFLSADRGGITTLNQWVRSAPPTLKIDLGQIHAMLRREQLNARIRGNRVTDSALMEQDADTERRQAQDALARYAETIVPSGMHIYDQSFFRLSAWTALVRADFKRQVALEAQVEQAELELELLELEYSLAIRAGHNDRILSSLETHIATLRLRLDGDPSFKLYPDYPALVEQRAALQHQMIINGSDPYYGPAANREQEELAARIAALDAEIALIEDLSRGLRVRRDEANANLERSTLYADEADAEWFEAMGNYNADIAASGPAFAATLAQWRELDWAADPRAAAALDDLEAIWPTGSPEDIMAALDVLGTAVDETYYHKPMGSINDLFMELGRTYDPRIAVLEGRRNFEASEALPGWMQFINSMLVDSATGGFLAYTENQRILNSPEASDSQRSSAKVGLVFDYAGFLLLNLGSNVRIARQANAVVDTSDVRLLSTEIKVTSPEDMALLTGLMDNGLDQRMLTNVLRTGDPAVFRDFMRRLRHLDVTASGVSASALDEAVKLARIKHPDVPIEELKTAINREVLRNSYIVGDTFVEGVRRADVDYLFVDQFPIQYQNNFIDSMDLDSKLVLRSRPPGTYKFDNIYGQKPHRVDPEDVLYKYEDGRRIVSMDGQITTVVSDVDVGDYMIGKHWVSNEEFIGRGGFMQRNTQRTGYNNINHGPLSNGLIMDDVLAAQGHRFKEFMEEEVYVIIKNADGTVITDKMPYQLYLERHNPKALAAINLKQGVR